MAYDPNLPANNSPIVSAELRSQFAGLKALIDAQQAQLTQVHSDIVDLQDAVNSLRAGNP
jgi:tRNA A37 threonylcarbamoyladenosine synthetase subunit TsaC/SUA5/YrdC